MGYPATPIKVRIENKIVQDQHNGCWLWSDALDKDGYGTLRIKKQTQRAHRVSYETYVGAIPEGMMVCHHCDVRCCINPDHFFVGTNVDNMRDMAVKGRAARSINPMPGARNGRASLTEIEAAQVLLAVFVEGKSRAEVARKFQVGKTAVEKLCAGKTWKHLDRPEAALLARYGADNLMRVVS